MEETFSWVELSQMQRLHSRLPHLLEYSGRKHQEKVRQRLQQIDRVQMSMMALEDRVAAGFGGG
jgi:hypothetical protein